MILSGAKLYLPLSADGRDMRGNAMTRSGAVHAGIDTPVGAGATYYDGVDDADECVTHPLVAGPYSMGCWAFVADTNIHVIMGTTHGNLPNNFRSVQIYYETTTYLILHRNAAGNNTGLAYVTGLSVGVWMHLCGTWDGTTGANGIKMYVNGVSGVDGTSTDTDITPQHSFQVGCTWAGQRSMKGYVRDAFVFPRVLSQGEIRNIMRGVEPAP